MISAMPSPIAATNATWCETPRKRGLILAGTVGSSTVASVNHRVVG
jgi:hypothetical protein